MDRGAWQATVHGDAQSWTALGDLVQHKEYLREEVPAWNLGTPKFRGWEDEEDPAKKVEKEQPIKQESLK